MLKVQEIREIIKLIDESSINEFMYETNGTKVSIKKPDQSQNGQTDDMNANVTSHPTVAHIPTTEENTAEVKQEVSTETVQHVEDEADVGFEIVSPMVGTFY